MEKTYTLVWNTKVETLTFDEMMKRFDEVEALGCHIEDAREFGVFDFMVCYW